MKKRVVALIDIVFLISLTLLGKFKLEQNSLLLGSYQIVVSLFWATGVLKFKSKDAEIKDFFSDTFKDFIISITIIPLWFWISGEKQIDLYEPITIILHLLILGFMVKFLVPRTVKLSGPIAYYTQAVIPLIAVVLIRLGLPIIVSVFIAVFLPEPVNYVFFKKKYMFK